MSSRIGLLMRRIVLPGLHLVLSSHYSVFLCKIMYVLLTYGTRIGIEYVVGKKDVSYPLIPQHN